MKKGQSDRLTIQQIEGQGPVTIFHEDAVIHDHEVSEISYTVLELIRKEYPALRFRYRNQIQKVEINEALKRISAYLGQTLYVNNASIKPDGGLIEVLDDNERWRVILVSEAKHQGNLNR